MTVDIIREAISDRLHIPLSRVLPKSNIIDDLGADSLDMMDILIEIEERLGIKIPDSLSQNIETPADLAAILESLEETV